MRRALRTSGTKAYRAFTLLEVALAISLVVTLSVITYVSLTDSQSRVGESGQNYQDNYLGSIETLLEEAEADDGSSSAVEPGS